MPRKLDINAKVQSLREFYADKRRSPGYNEMLEIFNYRSKNAVHGLLRKLEDLGYVSLEDRKLTLTGKLTGNIRLLGTVQAGFPSPAEEELVDILSLDEFLVENPEATFMLEVTGDSMIDAGIHPGDIVLIDKSKTARNNDIVIAEVDGEWTMKYFMKDKQGVRLEPANKAYSTIRPCNSLRIGGVVRTVIRKYA
jgi:SOS regulatory protein LexA